MYTHKKRTIYLYPPSLLLSLNFSLPPSLIHVCFSFFQIDTQSACRARGPSIPPFLPPIHKQTSFSACLPPFLSLFMSLSLSLFVFCLFVLIIKYS